ncbi:hypothetical protein GLAREA_00875 [Glarea lozoyensis ATCC 20868]|uniref:Spo12-like protein n=1 Tax=Glarea lozoyensis (strain ATCC 20868 / MF5171) TaxID=1116229 RepID=S3CVP7_GLAL2|nr:uncharacterized protein GLAREA_00875 [Glarea lozoyensis ATCC 20868]EPE29715.1 hypothetical protein GLAREA_00875 [Glarea lozoyensis ATCC 20868]
MSSNVLVDRDINATVTAAPETMDGKVDIKSMEYHRQVLQSKIDQQQGKQSYISPSDTIMSPCTQKLSAYRNKQVSKTKPKSLFAKTSAKSLAGGSNMFGSQPSTTDSKPSGL